MDPPLSFKPWYAEAEDGGLGPTSSIVDAAFEKAKVQFESDSAIDPQLLELTRSKTNFKEVQVTVHNAKLKYDSERRSSKARKWLDSLSQRIHFYSGVLDVIAQHHPEYVALAWGTVKFLLTAAINHEKIVKTLAKAISEIADALPRVGLQSSLYPTKQMAEAVTQLYVSIFQFFARARQWYQENSIQRLIHSITHPVELQYEDLLNEVKQCSRSIDRLSYCGAQAETRDMHRTVQTMQAESRDTQRTVQVIQAENRDMYRRFQTLISVVEKIHTTTSSTSPACINTNDIVSDLQFGQIMETLSKVSVMDPTKSFQYHCSLRRQRSRSATIHSVPNNFAQSIKLRSWSSTQDSTLAVVLGNYQARYLVRDFCVEVIQQLNEAKVHVLLALKTDTSTSPATISVIDVLKYLVRQAITLRQKAQTEKGMALRCATIYEADTATKWFHILEAVLAELRGLVYIIIDVELLDKNLQPADNFPWIQQFHAVFRDLKARGIAIIVKVVLVSCSPLPFQLTDTDRSNFVVQARTQVVTARQRKAGRAKLSTQLPFRLKGLPASRNRLNSSRTM